MTIYNVHFQVKILIVILFYDYLVVGGFWNVLLSTGHAFKEIVTLRHVYYSYNILWETEHGCGHALGSNGKSLALGCELFYVHGKFIFDICYLK